MSASTLARSTSLNILLNDFVVHTSIIFCDQDCILIFIQKKQNNGDRPDNTLKYNVGIGQTL